MKTNQCNLTSWRHSRLNQAVLLWVIQHQVAIIQQHMHLHNNLLIRGRIVDLVTAAVTLSAYRIAF